MVGREAMERVLEKTEALMRVLDERQGDLDDQCTVNVIQALVDLIEAICPNPPRLVRDITNFLRSKTSTLSEALSATGSSPIPTTSTSPRDHPSSSETSLNSIGHGDGLMADNKDASEMTIEAGQGQGAEPSSFPMPGSNFDAVLQQLQPDTTSSPVHGSGHNDFLDLFRLVEQGSGSPPELEATRGAGHLQDMADTLPSPRFPSSPLGSGWPLDTESGVNAATQPGPSALDTDMDMSDLLPFLGAVDSSSSGPLPPLHMRSPDCCQTDDDGENVVAQPSAQPPPDTDIDMLNHLFFPDIVGTSSNDPLPPLPMQSPDCCQTDDDGENVVAQPSAQQLPDTDIDMLNQLFFPDMVGTSSNDPLPPLPMQSPDCCQTDDDDENDIAQPGPFLSPAHSPVDMDMDSVGDFDLRIASDNTQTGLDSSSPTAAVVASPASPVSPVSPVSSVVTQALEKIRTAVEHGDLHGLPIDEIPSTALFKFPWGNLNGTTVRCLFRQFSYRDSMIGNEAIDYLSRKLASSELWIGRWSQWDQFRSCPRILFVRNDDTKWSLIEAQLEAGTITYYTCSPSDSRSSPSPDGIISTIDRLLGRDSPGASVWDFQVVPITNQSGCDALLVPWTITLRAKGKDPLSPMPADYHLSLLKKLVSDLKAVCSNLAVLQNRPRINCISIHGEGQLEKFWIEFGNGHGYGLRFWQKIQDLATIPVGRDKTMGHVRASELLQMALSIASPESFIPLKGCIEQLRSLLASKGHSFSESLQGLSDALRCHSTRNDLSKIGIRIGQWKAHMLKSELKEELEQILQAHPEHSDARGQVQEMLGSAKKGVYWSHIVEHAANGNPNILCLVPRAARMGPFDGELIEEFRPGVITSIDANLSNVLVYVRDPLGCYPLEQLSETQIREQKLSSGVFCEAMVLQQRDSLS